MKYIVYTNSPKQLVSRLKELIDDETIKTFHTIAGKKGRSAYVHSPEEWHNIVVEKKIYRDAVAFYVTHRENAQHQTEKQFAHVMGQFMEILLANLTNYYEYIHVKK